MSHSIHRIVFQALWLRTLPTASPEVPHKQLGPVLWAVCALPRWSFLTSTTYVAKALEDFALSRIELSHFRSTRPPEFETRVLRMGKLPHVRGQHFVKLPTVGIASNFLILSPPVACSLPWPHWPFDVLSTAVLASSGRRTRVGLCCGPRQRCCILTRWVLALWASARFPDLIPRQDILCRIRNGVPQIQIVETRLANQNLFLFGLELPEDATVVHGPGYTGQRPAHGFPKGSHIIC